jgi:drug/metabolite transporter (DMT)-like permease
MTPALPSPSPPCLSPRKRFWTGLAIAVPVLLAWGVTFVSTKALLSDFSSLEILFLRFLVAWLALWCLWPRPLKLRGGWKDEFLFVGAGLSGATVYQLLENLAIHFTNASNVSILVSICPVFTALLSCWLLRERVRVPLFAAGFFLATVGVVLVSLNGIRVFRFHPAGDLLAVASSLSWAVYSVLVTLVNRRRYPPIPAIRRAFFWALLSMLPLLALAGTAPDLAQSLSCGVELSPAANAARFSSPLNWLNLLFLGLFASGLCFVGWNAACRLLGTVRASSGIYLLPAITLLFAHVFLGETLTAAGALGAIVTLAGVILSGHRPKRSNRQPVH